MDFLTLIEDMSNTIPPQKQKRKNYVSALRFVDDAYKKITQIRTECRQVHLNGSTKTNNNIVERCRELRESVLFEYCHHLKEFGPCNRQVRREIEILLLFLDQIENDYN